MVIEVFQSYLSPIQTAVRLSSSRFPGLFQSYLSPIQTATFPYPESVNALLSILP